MERVCHKSMSRPEITYHSRHSGAHPDVCFSWSGKNDNYHPTKIDQLQKFHILKYRLSTMDKLNTHWPLPLVVKKEN